MAGIDDPEIILRPLANYLRPKLVEFWKQRRKALFTENADRMKSLLDNLQKKLDEVREYIHFLFILSFSNLSIPYKIVRIVPYKLLSLYLNTHTHTHIHTHVYYI